MPGQVRSINCTQCGAPLTLHGGHRVESLTCGFCGSVLDAHEDFKVVRTYADLKRPYSPLALGMSGKIKDVEFTIIGMVQYRDAWHDSWLEYAIYSPTHGYAWVAYEHGHFLFRFSHQCKICEVGCARLRQIVVDVSQLTTGDGGQGQIPVHLK